jgi:hypothetical protein
VYGGAVGDYTVKVKASTPGGTTIANLEMTLKWTIKAQCDPPAAVQGPTIADKESRLDNTDYTHTWDAWTTTGPTNCGLTYTVSGYDAISSIVTVDLIARTIKVKGTNNQLAGVYTLTINALSPTGGALSTASSATMKLTLLENKATSSRAVA